MEARRQLDECQDSIDFVSGGKADGIGAKLAQMQELGELVQRLEAEQSALPPSTHQQPSSMLQTMMGTSGTGRFATPPRPGARTVISGGSTVPIGSADNTLPAIIHYRAGSLHKSASTCAWAE